MTWSSFQVADREIGSFLNANWTDGWKWTEGGGKRQREKFLALRHVAGVMRLPIVSAQ